MALKPDAERTAVIQRHSLLVRVAHWINAVCVLVLLASGLQIFNAHPALYFGEDSDFDHPFLSIDAVRTSEGLLRGQISIAGRAISTTGVLGASQGPSGRAEPRAFPAWATLPSWQDLATGRRWHFFFAWLFVVNGAAYLLYALASRHASRNLLPSRHELRRIHAVVVEHLRLQFLRTPADRGYNVLQKLAYATIIFVVLPTLVIAGWAMSPGLNATFPWMVDIFGGRQGARTAHFLAATVLVLFAVMHVAMVMLSGAFNNMRGMITGRYRVKAGGDSDG